MRILTNEECLLVAGGYMSGSASSNDPGLYMVESYYDESTPLPPEEPPVSVPQDPFFQSLGASLMTADDAHVLAELFASANYSVGEVTPVATGAYQGSGPAWGGLGEDFMFAVNMYSAFQNMANYHAPDQAVMAALDNAGISYSVGENGSIYAPGYGYAVADGTSFTPAASLDGGSGQTAPYGSSNTVLIMGNPNQSSLVGVPMFGGETIVVTGEVRNAGVVGWIVDKVGGYLFDGLIEEVEDWLTNEPNTSREEMKQRLAQMEPVVAAMFDPSKPYRIISVPARDGSVMSGFIQDNKFFTDVNGNGIVDLAFTQNAGWGQYYVHYGAGWKATGNPFTTAIDW